MTWQRQRNVWRCTICVAIAATEKIPDLSILQDCESHNRDGGGIAWLTPKKEGKKRLVRWKKGLTAVQMHDLIESENIDPPCLIHFRIATVGGTDKSLCHPFPVSRRAPDALEGVASRVLIHNGHWDNWCSKTLWGLITSNGGVPGGKWSDSRAMAWLTSHFGDEILKFIPAANKIATLDSDGAVLMYNDFTKDDGAYYSNTYWKRRPTVLAPVRHFREWEGGSDYSYSPRDYTESYKSGSSDLWGASELWKDTEQCVGCGGNYLEKYAQRHYDHCVKYAVWLKEDNSKVIEEIEERSAGGLISELDIVKDETDAHLDERRALEEFFHGIEAKAAAIQDEEAA